MSCGFSAVMVNSFLPCSSFLDSSVWGVFVVEVSTIPLLYQPHMGEYIETKQWFWFASLFLRGAGQFYLCRSLFCLTCVRAHLRHLMEYSMSQILRCIEQASTRTTNQKTETLSKSIAHASSLTPNSNTKSSTLAETNHFIYFFFEIFKPQRKCLGDT